MSSVGLSSPEVSEARKVYALFNRDPDIDIVYDKENTEVKLYVNNPIKAAALSEIVIPEKQLGNVTLKITVIPSNEKQSNIDIIRQAFAGNPVVSDIIVDDSPSQIGFSHVLFENNVVQYFNDCLNDPFGLESTLYEDLARDVLTNVDGVFFNTDGDEDFSIWP